MPKVSVIIPVYGVESYIERCAVSLFNQTLEDMEFLFIDDCSPDNSMSILMKVIERFPHRKGQIITHRMPQNSGQAAVRKWGMLHATGDYIIHCDSDDWVDTDMYRSMYEKATSEDLDVVICDYNIVAKDKTTSRKGIKRGNSIDDIISDILNVRTSSSIWNKLFKRSIFSKPNFVYPSHNMGEDMVICIGGLIECKSFACIKKPFYNYLVRENSIVNDPSKIISNFKDTLANIAIVEKQITAYHPTKFRWQLLTLKTIKKERIAPLLDQEEYKTIWKNTFTEVGLKFIFNPFLPLKRKIKNIFYWAIT